MLTNLFVTSDGPIRILVTSVVVVLGKYWQYLINLLEQNNTTIAPNLSGFQKVARGGGKSTLITIAGNCCILLSTCQITSRRALV